MRINNITNLLTKILLCALGIMAGFTWIVIGTLSLPQIEAQLILLNRPFIDFTMFIISGGIAGGAIILSAIGIKFALGEM